MLQIPCKILMYTKVQFAILIFGVSVKVSYLSRDSLECRWCRNETIQFLVFIVQNVMHAGSKVSTHAIMPSCYSSIYGCWLRGFTVASKS